MTTQLSAPIAHYVGVVSKAEYNGEPIHFRTFATSGVIPEVYASLGFVTISRETLQQKQTTVLQWVFEIRIVANPTKISKIELLDISNEVVSRFYEADLPIIYQVGPTRASSYEMDRVTISHTDDNSLIFSTIESTVNQ